MAKSVTIKEIENHVDALKQGKGTLTLYGNMPDEVILKKLKKAIQIADGNKFTVQVFHWEN